jgi:organic radical activating enzyme
MNDQKRRFRPRPQRNGFRPRNNGGQNSNGHFQSNGGGNLGRNNGSMTNPFNVEKTVQKYQQLAKDALTSGDPVLQENYLQHAEHFNRRLSELNVKPKETPKETSKEIPKEIKEPKEQKTENISLAEKLNKQSLEKKEVV